VTLDNTLIALADPTRRAILSRLLEGEARVTEVAAPFPISLNSVSKHIRILERADLVRRRVSGRDHHLRLNRGPLDEVAEWVETTRAFWSSKLDTLEALLRAESECLVRVTEPRPRRALRDPGRGIKRGRRRRRAP
jgi:DNA-binding transcriptional ArsR family regulator